MIWFEIKKVENKILKNKLTEKDGFYYYLATGIFCTVYLFFHALINFKHAPNSLSYLLGIIIAILGLIQVFKINNEIDGREFLKRYFALTWVIRVKLVIVTFIFFAIAMNFFDVRKDNPAKSITYFIFALIVQILFYLLVIKSIQ